MAKENVKATLSGDYTMKLSEASNVIKSALKAGLASFIWGPPGLGKTALIQQIVSTFTNSTKDKNSPYYGKPWEVIVVRAVLLDPVDLRGIPVIDTDSKKTRWCPPEFIPTHPDWEGVIFLDELPQAAPMAQSACLQLLDGMVGDFKISKGARIVAAGNRQSDRAGAHSLITPLLNRFSAHVEVHVDKDDWLDWAGAIGENNEPRVCSEITSFIAWKGNSALMNFNPTSGERSFPTPRSWEFLSKMLRGVDSTKNEGATWSQIANAAIGLGGATEFITFLKIFHQLPSIEDILSGKYSFSKDSKSKDYISIQWALSGICRDFVTSKSYSMKDLKKEDKEYIKNLNDVIKIMAFISSLDEEIQVAFLRRTLKGNNTNLVQQIMEKRNDKATEGFSKMLNKMIEAGWFKNS